MNSKTRVLIHLLCIICLCMFAFDLCLSITKVTILTKPVSNTDLALKLETEKIIYVSTTGDDSNNGLTEITAKKTIQGALEEAKQYINNQNTTIKVGSGHYYITEPIQINNSYTSGSKGYTLKIEGYSNTKPTIDGGKIIENNWSVENVNEPNIWVTTIDKDLDISGLYVDGKLKEIAGEEIEEINPSSEGLTTGTVSLNIDIDRIRKEIKNLKLIIEFEDIKNIVSLYSVGRNSNGSAIIYYTDESWFAMTSVNKKYAGIIPKYTIINSKEFLDQEGEYYYNRSTGKLYYYSNKNPNESLVVIPSANGLLNIQGEKTKLTSNIEIKNLNFKYGTDTDNLKTFWTDIYDLGYKEKDKTSGEYSPRKAQINIKLASNISIDNCNIENCTTNGINIGDYSYNVKIYNSFFENLGGSAVRVGEIHEKTATGEFRLSDSEQDSRSLPTDAEKVFSVTNNTNYMPVQIAITNNIIENVGNVYKSTPGIIVGVANTISIKKNTLQNIPGSGISIGQSNVNALNELVSRKSGSIIVEENKLENTVNSIYPGAPIVVAGPFTNGGFSIKNNYIIRGNAQNNNSEFGTFGGIYLSQGTDNGYVTNNVVDGFKNWINERAIYYDDNTELVNQVILRNIQIAQNYFNTELERYSFKPKNNLDESEIKSFDSTRNDYNSKGNITNVRTSGEANGAISAQNVKNTNYFTSLNITNPNVTYNYTSNIVLPTSWNTAANDIITNAGSTIVKQTDLEGPIINVDYEKTTRWLKENVEVSIKVTDESGVDKVTIIKDEIVVQTIELDENGNGSFIVEESGIYKIIAKDIEGNKSIELLNISNIDKNGPTITVRKITPTTSKIEIEADIIDDVSGVDTVEYRLVKSRLDPTPITGSNWQEENIITGLKANTTYFIQIRAIDIAENESTIIVEGKTGIVPKAEENITITPNTTIWTKENVILELESNYEEYQIEYSTNDVTYRPLDNNKRMIVEKNQTLFFRFTDGINNGESIDYSVKNIDKIAPRVKYTEKKGSKNKIVYKSNIVEKGSGLKEVKYNIVYKNVEYKTEIVYDGEGNPREQRIPLVTYIPIEGFDWQDEPIFEGLEEKTDYYIWCHLEDNVGNEENNYEYAPTGIHDELMDINNEQYREEDPRPSPSSSTSPSPSSSTSPSPSSSTSPSPSSSTSPSPSSSTSPSPSSSTSPSPSSSTSPSPTNQEKTRITSETFEIKEEQNYIRVNQEMNINSFKKNITVNKPYTIVNNLENEITSGEIKTGYNLKTDDSTYYIILIGDIGGNGKIDVTDLAKLRQHIVGVSNRILTGVNFEAADINSNGRVDILDLAKIRRIIVGLQ